MVKTTTLDQKATIQKFKTLFGGLIDSKIIGVDMIHRSGLPYYYLHKYLNASSDVTKPIPIELAAEVLSISQDFGIRLRAALVLEEKISYYREYNKKQHINNETIQHLERYFQAVNLKCINECTMKEQTIAIIIRSLIFDREEFVTPSSMQFMSIISPHLPSRPVYYSRWNPDIFQNNEKLRKIVFQLVNIPNNEDSRNFNIKLYGEYPPFSNIRTEKIKEIINTVIEIMCKYRGNYTKKERDLCELLKKIEIGEYCTHFIPRNSDPLQYILSFIETNRSNVIKISNFIQKVEDKSVCNFIFKLLAFTDSVQSIKIAILALPELLLKVVPTCIDEVFGILPFFLIRSQKSNSILASINDFRTFIFNLINDKTDIERIKNELSKPNDANRIAQLTSIENRINERMSTFNELPSDLQEKTTQLITRLQEHNKKNLYKQQIIPMISHTIKMFQNSRPK